MSRTIVNHNAQAWADDYLALSNRCLAHASEIETSGTAHPLHWHIYGQLQSIGRLAFDIQACILRANLPITDKETDMQDITFTPLTTNGLGEICDKLNELSIAIKERQVDEPHSMTLQLALAAARQAMTSINGLDEYIAQWHQAREDQAAVYAIRRALEDQFASDGNVEGARGMLADVAASGDLILQAIRDAGYQVTPLG